MTQAMTWTGPKQDPHSKKWYRLRETPTGERELLESDDQWGVCQGLGDDYHATFSHYFKQKGIWQQQRDLPYAQLMVEPYLSAQLGFTIEKVPPSQDLDARFAALLPLNTWATYLHEQLNDCQMAIDYADAQLTRLLTELKQGKGGKRSQLKKQIKPFLDKMAVLGERHAHCVQVMIEAEEELRDNTHFENLLDEWQSFNFKALSN